MSHHVVAACSCPGCIILRVDLWYGSLIMGGEETSGNGGLGVVVMGWMCDWFTCE